MSWVTRVVRVAVLAIAASCVLTACTTPAPRLVEGSLVRVAVAEPLTSLGPQPAGGGSVNAAVAGMTHSRFFDYNIDGQVVADPSFGSAKVVEGSGFAIEYTVTSGVTWSDGVPVDGVDLLLAWVAGSGARNSVDDGAENSVHFEGEDVDGLAHARTAELGADGRSLTLHYESVPADWQLAFEVGAPAHVLASIALGIDDPEAAKTAVEEAILSSDREALGDLSRSWNSLGDVSGGVDERMFVGNGPYSLARVTTDSVTLVANPAYTGSRRPLIETVELSVIPDALDQIDALASGAVDVASVTTSTDVRAAIAATTATVVNGPDNTYDHVDLQFSESKSGVFDDPLVREAFLKTIPRDLIAEAALGDEGEARSSFVFLPGTDEYAAAVDSNGSDAFAEADPEGARELLASVGLASPEVCILYPAEDVVRAGTFQLIQRAAAEGGFVVTDCSAPDLTTALGVSGAYDAALFGWNAPYLATSTVTNLLRSDGGDTNLNRYSNPEMDELLDRLAGEQDETARVAVLAEIDSLLWDDAYGLPLYQHQTITAFSDSVAGIVPSPFGGTALWNVWDWEPLA